MTKVRVLEVLRDAEGGMKRHVETLASGLDKELYHILLACPKDQFDENDITGFGIAASYQIDLGDKQSPMALIKALKDLRKIIIKEDIDFIHAHGMTCTIAANLATLGAGNAKILSTVHNFPGASVGVKKYVYSLLLGISLRSSNHVIFVSEALRRYAKAKWNIPEAKTSVIYNGMDINSIEVSSGHSLLDMQPAKIEEPPTALCIARLIPEKGVDIYIKAAALVLEKISIKNRNNKTYPVFLIAGIGPEDEKLKKMPIQMGIEGYVRFLGYRDDIYQLIRESDFIVLASYSEGLGLSLLEAMALKKPVIGTSVGGIPEVVIPNKTGLLVPPGNPEALAKAMYYTMQNADIAKKMGEAGYSFVKERFTKEKMISEFQSVLDRIGR